MADTGRRRRTGAARRSSGSSSKLPLIIGGVVVLVVIGVVVGGGGGSSGSNSGTSRTSGGGNATGARSMQDILKAGFAKGKATRDAASPAMINLLQSSAGNDGLTQAEKAGYSRASTEANEYSMGYFFGVGGLSLQNALDDQTRRTKQSAESEPIRAMMPEEARGR
jgi:hypothetical protein